jgi:hypothetical protein
MTMTTATEIVDHSQTLGALAKALAKAQGQITGAKKTAKNPHLKNHYATLSDVWDACREALTAHDLAVTQTFEPHGREGVCVVTTLIHASGEWMRSRLFLPVTKTDAQGFGSAATYARRYSLAAMVGVAPEDDDANAATGRTSAPVEEPARPTKAASDEVEAKLSDLLTAATSTDALAKAEAAAARAAKAGELTDAARVRLRELRAQAVKRVQDVESAA